MSCSSARATNALITPIRAAMPVRVRTRLSAVKSPSRSSGWRLPVMKWQCNEPMPRQPTSQLATTRSRDRLLCYRDDFPAVFRRKPLHPTLRRRPMPLPSLRRPRSAIVARTTLFLTLFAAACDHSPSGPGSNSIQFSRTVSLPDAQSLLQTGPTRVEVRVIPGMLVARRVELEESSEMRSEEHTSELQSRGHLVCRLL